MFEKTTLKLTAWYLIIIMLISLLFSALVYQASTMEVHSRLKGFQKYAPAQVKTFGEGWSSYSQAQADEAAHNIMINLVYVNLAILVAGGIASYQMARRTLRPLKEAHESEMRFVSDASHELRTPLTAMKTELEVALRDPNISSNELRELLESNLEEVDKLTQLSQSLLTLSRLDSQDMSYEKIDIKQIVADIVARYDKSSRRIEVEQPKSSLHIYAHTTSLEQLVTILIDNALKYSPDDSTINIHLQSSIGRVKLTIANAGEGITPADLPYIFDRFYRADNSRSNSGNSFGLGLSIAKTIVKRHQGEINATSQPGKLTTFCVSLPSAKDFKK